jgi:hypothetical protein
MPAKVELDFLHSADTCPLRGTDWISGCRAGSSPRAVIPC